MTTSPPIPVTPRSTGAASDGEQRPAVRARLAAVVVNPTKLDDGSSLREDLTAALAEAGWEPPLWLETSAEDPGYGMTEQALQRAPAW